jgi:hypothetical protein
MDKLPQHQAPQSLGTSNRSWSPARLALLKKLREWALADEEFCLCVYSDETGCVAFFKAQIDACKTDEELLEMIHKRLNILQPRSSQ